MEFLSENISTYELIIDNPDYDKLYNYDGPVSDGYYDKIFETFGIKYIRTCKNTDTLKNLLISFVKNDISRPIILRPHDLMSAAKFGTKQYVKFNPYEPDDRKRISGPYADQQNKLDNYIEELSNIELYMMNNNLFTLSELHDLFDITNGAITIDFKKNSKCHKVNNLNIHDLHDDISFLYSEYIKQKRIEKVNKLWIDK